MNPDDLALKLIEGLDNYLIKNANACLAIMTPESVAPFIQSIGNAVQNIMALTGGGEGSSGGAGDTGGQGGNGTPSVAVGTITNVALSGSGEVVRALVLGEQTGDVTTLPTGVGSDQRFWGGVILANDVQAQDFVISPENLTQMSPTGHMNKLEGENSTLSLNEVTTVTIHPDEKVVLAPKA